MAACAAFGMCVDYSAAPRVHAITSHMVDRIERSRIGQSFYAKAVARGMVGEARLKELTVVVLFAGFGGTGGLLEHTLNYLQKNEQNTPMFKQCVQDADSVLLEGARLFPPVGGINPYVIAEDREITLGNGRKHFERAGEYGSMSMLHHLSLAAKCVWLQLIKTRRYLADRRTALPTRSRECKNKL